ncbi:MAG: EAL domain-containing protein [Pseudomonadota bacterium]|nr:EAL domain-containing protein [Pseudomonadota bacterium]
MNEKMQKNSKVVRDIDLEFQQVAFIVVIGIIGVFLTVVVTLVLFEVVMISPPTGVEMVASVHSGISVGNPGIFEGLQEKLPLYRDLTAILWPLWFIPLSGLATTLATILMMRRHVFTANYKKQLSFYRQGYLREQTLKQEFKHKYEDGQVKFYDIQDELDVALIVLTLSDTIEFVNKSAKAYLEGWATRANRTIQTVGFRIHDVFPAYMTSGLHLMIQEAVNKQEYMEKEIFVEAIDTWLMVKIIPAEEEVYFYFKDISEGKETDNFFKSTSGHVLETMTINSPTPVAVLNRQWDYIAVSESWKEVFKLSGTLRGRNHTQMVPWIPKDIKSAEAELLAGHEIKVEADEHMIGGQKEILNWNMVPWHDTEHRIAGYVAYAVPVTESMRLKSRESQDREREKQLAYHDILTGLPNRQLFYDRLNMALAQAYRQVTQVAVLFLDLDGFKAVNDNLGHDVGDILLKKVAERLTAIVRDTDTVARLGGDEFTVILTGISDQSHVAAIGEKIIKSISEPYKIGPNDVHVSTSIGASIYPDDGSSTTDIIKKSDQAMYHAKTTGKNRFVYFQHMESEKKDTEPEIVPVDDLASDLKTAIQKNELTAHYQAIHQIETGKILGFETMMRWNHPRKGMLKPAQFMQYAEETNLILPLGEWALKDALETQKQLSERCGYPVTVWMNVSEQQLLDPTVLRRFERVIDESGVPSKYIAFDISEDIFINQSELAIEPLKSLLKQGHSVAIDNFGVGEKPLGNLKQLPVNTLKIHPTFIQRIERSEKDRKIVQTIMKITRDLRFGVIAVGVENDQQKAFLHQVGCLVMQGNLLSEPMNKEDI